MEVGLSGTNASSNSSETNEYSGEWARANKMSWSTMERAFQQHVGLGDKEAELPDSVEGGLQQRAGFDDKEAELPDSVEGGLQQRAGLDDKEAELPDTVERASMEIECSKPDNQKQGIVVMDLTTESGVTASGRRQQVPLNSYRGGNSLSREGN